MGTPPDYNSCTCVHVCADAGLTIPETCGDGQCTTGEDTTNCFNDCAFGVPAEEPTTTCQGDGPWVPQGDDCGISFSPTIETPEGTWETYSIRDNDPEEYLLWPAGDTSFPNGHIYGQYTYYAPTWEDCEERTPSYYACTNEHMLRFYVDWFDRGRDKPVGDHAEWRAMIESQGLHACAGNDAACVNEIVFSPTHWISLEYQVPTRWETSWIEARVQEYLTLVEPHAWPR